jgi:hypothetical protein
VSKDAVTGDPPPEGHDTPSAAPPAAPGHFVHDLRQRATRGGAEGAHAAAELGHAAQALHLQVVTTELEGDQVLRGHVLGLRLLMHAEGLHGPRETPVLVYLFADALALRVTDDAPMSTVPLLGLHMVLPPLAVAHWLYKAGRVTHANVDLAKDAERFEESLAGWTVDDFAEADAKLQVYRLQEVEASAHVYQQLAFAHLWIPVHGARPVRLKSALPPGADAFGQLARLFESVPWPHGMSAKPPVTAIEEEPSS